MRDSTSDLLDAISRASFFSASFSALSFCSCAATPSAGPSCALPALDLRASASILAASAATLAASFATSPASASISSRHFSNSSSSMSSSMVPVLAFAMAADSAASLRASSLAILIFCATAMRDCGLGERELGGDAADDDPLVSAAVVGFSSGGSSLAGLTSSSFFFSVWAVFRPNRRTRERPRCSRGSPAAKPYCAVLGPTAAVCAVVGAARREAAADEQRRVAVGTLTPADAPWAATMPGAIVAKMGSQPHETLESARLGFGACLRS
mmetsp:Transcript_30118/g.77269  ORF Transcript_30118/g.77269 Transcript_30118/m.77269 type:complete len:269 (+) Transcript_30118:73-879(+)